jgi:hypothetical protein
MMMMMMFLNRKITTCGLQNLSPNGPANTALVQNELKSANI